MPPTVLRVKTRTLSGKRLEVTVPELEENEEVELIILRAETKAETQPQEFASAWEYLQSLSPIKRTPEEWAEIEREMQKENDAWSD